MKIDGGCYCGALRYRAEGDPMVRAQCHCRECQYISGGGPNFTMGMPESGFTYTRGSPKAFRRSDLENPVTREFCPECGTHILNNPPALRGYVMIKAGTFDDPSLFGKPDMAIFTKEKQPFHTVPDGISTYEGVPG